MQAIGLYVKDLKSNEVGNLLTTNAKELNDTYIAFSGNKTLDKVGDYFRIDGLSVWIEYNTQQSRDRHFPPTHPYLI